MAGGAPQRRDLTKGHIGRTLMLFALPTLGSNILQSLNGSINAVWVGRFLGESALAATSNANIIMFLTFGAVFGFGMAATVMIGQAIGRHDLDAARRAFGSAVGLVLGGALIMAILGWLFAPDILKLLATPGDAMPLALAYLRVIFLGIPASMLLVLLMMGLRGSGDAMTPFWFMILSVLLDAGLNPVFILGLGPVPRMGIAGAATATLIANHVAAIGLLATLYIRDLPIRLRGREFRYLLPERDLMRTIVAKGLPMGAQMLVMSLGGLTMIGLVNRLGVDTAAAYGVSQQLWTYIQMPAMAIGAAVSAMAAQNIGAGAWDRVNGITRAGLLWNCVITGAMVGVVLLFDRPVMALFLGGESPAIPIARHIQLIASWNFVLFGMTMVIFATVRANGAVWAPLIALIVALYPIRIGFALGLEPLLGGDALWWSFPVGSAAALGLAAAYFRWGDWRKGAMIRPREAEEQALATTEPAGRLQPTG
ncbi:MATE family efflux transporter [Sphingomonas sp. UNC305MFCol5.2]|uniref:MATE family efflux transporter n=1 Tax=Sphingomonas sp. UNC305MFCol5.2 TaxID=1449076 RepID=UPI0004A784D4|nr:MATE family efflux transporter [Sphingomonas sp. UNC305MFCol5.2]